MPADGNVPATKRLYDPRLSAGTAEHLCDDHAAEALNERPDDGLVVTEAPPGATCGRCAEKGVAALDLDAIEERHQAAERGGWYSRADAEFKSRAREDIPALVAEIRRLRQEILDLRTHERDL